MSYLSILRKGKDISTVAFTEFALATRKCPAHLFCFFEGNDNPYYMPRIKKFTSNCFPINCGGREVVLTVHRLISAKPEYSNYKKAFFIDRDFNPPHTALLPPIFETPCYSIENFYVSPDVFRKILINQFHLSEITDDAVIELYLKTYRDRQVEFHNAIALFNAWYACLIDIRNASQTSINAILEDKLPKGFITLSLQAVGCHYDLEKIKNEFPQATEVDAIKLQEKLTAFQQQATKHHLFRGKYELQFLTDFINRLVSDSTNPKAAKLKSSFAVGDASQIKQAAAMAFFSPYAETPNSLNDYLQQVLSPA